MNFSVRDPESGAYQDIVFRKYGDQGYRVFWGDRHIGMCWRGWDRGTWRAQTNPTLERGSKVVNGFATRIAVLEWLLQEVGLYPWMSSHEWDDEKKAWCDPLRESLSERV